MLNLMAFFSLKKPIFFFQLLVTWTELTEIIFFIEQDFKRQLKTVTFRWQENQMQIKKRDKIITSLNQQVAFGINKVSK